MEKYRQFADHGTGVNPFVPIHQVREYSAASKVRGALHRFLTGPLLVLLRLPLLLVVVLWLGLIAAPLAMLVQFIPGVGPAASGALRRALQAPAARFALLLMGFYRIEQSEWPVLAPHLAAQRKPSPRPRAGDVVLCNLASYVDALAHASMCAPLFAFATDDAEGHPGQTRLVVRGLLGALRYAARDYVSAQRVAGSGKAVDLATAQRKAAAAGVPLVLFVEGAPTNGRGVMAPPADALAALDEAQRKGVTFHCVALRYERPRDVAGSEGSHRWSPCYPVGPFLPHFLGLVSRPAHVILVTRPSAEKTPQFPQVGNDARLLLVQLVRRLCDSTDGRLAVMTRARTDKRAFLKHWGSTQGAGAAAYSPSE